MRLEHIDTRVHGYRIHSAHIGDGAPIVLLHGLSGSHRWWRFNFRAFAQDHRVHIPELIGFGRSRPAERLPTIAEGARLLIDWLDRLGIERTHLVGHSMGGQISIHVAAEAPDRVDRLVLVNAAGVPRKLSPAAVVRLATELLPPGAWGRLGFLPTIVRDAVRAGPRALLRAIRHLLNDDIRPLLPRIQSPTLLLWGGRDRLVPLAHARLMESTIPNVRLLVLPDAAHNPMADRPRRFNRAVLDFIDSPDVAAA